MVKAALDLGINFIDTAENYGTEAVVGQALQAAKREQIVLSTKAGVNWKDRKCTGAEMKERIKASQKRLQTGYVDIFHLHGVSASDYPYAVEELVPALKEMQQAGDIRFLGITEAFGPDPKHQMLSPAVEDDCWDVVMVGFNILNQSARSRVLAATQRSRIGTLCMFAVRRALSQPEALRQLMQELVAQNLVDAAAIDAADPLGFLLTEGQAESIPDAAYRFCRWEPGLDVILSGTSSVEHLRENAASLARPALPDEVVTRLQTLFQQVDTVSGN
ncbi:MAG: aldo/keto reductase [Chthonomonadaceae bacterium]|nr:aldo/keto reductase [Chthonomonadaceae bacterium]